MFSMKVRIRCLHNYEGQDRLQSVAYSALFKSLLISFARWLWASSGRARTSAKSGTQMRIDFRYRDISRLG